MNDRIILPVSIIIAGLLIGGGYYLNSKTSNGILPSNQLEAKSSNLKNTIRPIDENDHILGSPDARVIIVEYSDTECPFCKTFHSTMLSIMKNYGSAGKVAWVYRHYPIAELHSKAPKEAEALECAAELGGNAKFWEYTNKIYEVTGSNNTLDPKELTKIAVDVGLSSEKFDLCLASGQYKPRVDMDTKNAKGMGASGTPYSILLDTKLGDHYPIEGAYQYDKLKAAIDIILNS